MKKSLVLALVLVMALSASAFAGFTGEWKSELTNDSFKVQEGGWELKNTLNFIASGKDEGWTLDAKIGGVDKLAIGEYQLTLKDDYFTAWVWGKGKELTDKTMHFDFIKAAKKEAGNGRVRLEVPATELAKVTLDFNPAAENNLKSFVDFKYAGQEFGIAADTKLQDDPENTIAGWGTIKYDPVTLKVAGGSVLAEDEDNLFYGAEATVKATDDISVTAKYVAKDLNAGDSKEVSGGATYEVTNIKANATYTTAGTFDEFNKNTISAYVAYREGTAVSFSNLFHNDHWFKADGLAAKVTGEQVVNTDTDSTTYTLTVDGAYPVVADLLVGRAKVSYKTNADANLEVAKYGKPEVKANAKNIVDASADLRVYATDKLELRPSASVKFFKDGAIVKNEADEIINITDGTVVVFGNVARYKLGTGSTVLTFEVKNTSYDLKQDAAEFKLDSEQLVKFGVTVKF